MWGTKKLAGYFLVFLAVLLSIGYILISFHTRYMFDDLGFSALVRDNGIWAAFKILYFSWETIYNTLVLFFLLKWNNYIPPYFYNISIFLLNIWCFYLLLKTIVRYHKIGITSKEMLLLAVLVISLTYFSGRARGYAVYWVTGQIVYCLFLSYLFLGLYFWIKGRLFLASVFMFLFAHTRINYDAIFIGLYVGYIISYWYENNKLVFNLKSQIPFLFFLFGIITYIIIPGNYVRLHSIRGPDPSLQIGVLVIMKGWISAFKHMSGIVLGSWKQLMILPIGLLIGFYFSNNASVQRFITPRFLLYYTLTFIICYIGQSTVIYISLKTPVGYNRIFFFLEMLLFILMLLYGMFAAFFLQSRLSPKIISPIGGFVFLAIIIPVSIDYYQSFKVTSVFAKAYDKRIQGLKDLRQHPPGKIVYVPKLPDSGVLEFMEIEPQSSNTTQLPDNNSVYVSYYNLPFKVYLAQ